MSSSFDAVVLAGRVGVWIDQLVPFQCSSRTALLNDVSWFQPAA